MIAEARAEGMKPIADAMLGKLISEETARSRPQIARELREIMESQRAETIAHALAAMRDRPDRTGVLGSINVPTLIIGGEKDGITPPEVMRGMHEKIKGSEMVVVAGAGHMTPMEQPAQVNRAMETFLGRV
jgi:pimeloyl-ACP methyl ester carboxylesterase